MEREKKEIRLKEEMEKQEIIRQQLEEKREREEYIANRCERIIKIINKSI